MAAGGLLQGNDLHFFSGGTAPSNMYPRRSFRQTIGVPHSSVYMFASDENYMIRKIYILGQYYDL
jgi:uncharacterized membrane protein YoaT (DUF817 family)